MSIYVRILCEECEDCENLTQNVHAAAEKLGVPVNIELSSDPQEYARHGLLSTPGLVVGGTLVSSGRVPEERELVSLLSDSLQTPAY